MNPNQKQNLSPSQSLPVDRLKLEIISLKGGVDGSGGGTLGCATATMPPNCAATLGCFADEE